MRINPRLFVIAALAGASGCVILGQRPDEGDTTGGATGGGEVSAGPCGGVETTGECAGEAKIRSCFHPEEEGAEPRLVEVDCHAGEVCQVVQGTAMCAPKGGCYEGAVQCKGASTLQTCANGAWVDAACGGGSECVVEPGQPAACAQALSEAGTGIWLSGHLSYELRVGNASLTGFDPKLHLDDGNGFLVTAYDGADMIGIGYTGTGGGGTSPGAWKIELSRKPTGQTYLYFWPLLFGDNGLPVAAVAHAESGDPLHQLSQEYWSWGFGPVCPGDGPCEAGDMGDLVITEDMGSGAAYVYQWLSYVLDRMTTLLPSVTPRTVVALWEPGNGYSCGACFVPPALGGARVNYGGGAFDTYQTSIALSGTDESPNHWSKSVINHELGHWIMDSYSRPPGEAAQHMISQTTPPGMAYSEGWASFAGQANASNGPDDPDPIYFTKQKGTFWWWNIANGDMPFGAIPPPDPGGPLDQPISEAIVATMLWSLWAEAGAPVTRGLGDQALFSTLGSKRLTGGMNRGYSNLDVVDFFDAMLCEGTASEADLAAVSEPLGYPWDGAAICP